MACPRLNGAEPPPDHPGPSQPSTGYVSANLPHRRARRPPTEGPAFAGPSASGAAPAAWPRSPSRPANCCSATSTSCSGCPAPSTSCSWCRHGGGLVAALGLLFSLLSIPPNRASAVTRQHGGANRCTQESGARPAPTHAFAGPPTAHCPPMRTGGSGRRRLGAKSRQGYPFRSGVRHAGRLRTGVLRGHLADRVLGQPSGCMCRRYRSALATNSETARATCSRRGS